MMGTRRGNNEGCIYKDKQGRWRGVISLPSSDGKYKRKYIYGKTRKEVSEKISEILNQLHTNTYVEPCKITLYSWLCTWIDTYCKNEVRMSTYVNYDIYIQKHIKDILQKNLTLSSQTCVRKSILDIRRFIDDSTSPGMQ